MRIFRVSLNGFGPFANKDVKDTLNQMSCNGVVGYWKNLPGPWDDGLENFSSKLYNPVFGFPIEYLTLWFPKEILEELEIMGYEVLEFESSDFILSDSKCQFVFSLGLATLIKKHKISDLLLTKKEIAI